MENESGRHWMIEERLSQLWSGADMAVGRSLRASASQTAETNPSYELLLLGRYFPQSALFVDLETCGFAGSALFLVGIVCAIDGELVLRQLLARNYAEEHSVLRAYWEYAAEKHVLVSFNGKSFDWPMLLDRTIRYHLSPSTPEPFIHCDLLHHSRRRWKDRLPNCKLQTLEWHICGRRRVGDIPGRDIPQAYHQYVRSGDAWEIRSILHHNALDLVTLVQLASELL